MTYPELIQDLIEKLLAERDKNNELQSKLEEYKKSKDQNVSYIVESGEVVTRLFYFLFKHKKSMCSYDTHTRKQYTYPELEYIV